MLHIEIDIMPRAKRSIRKTWSKIQVATTTVSSCVVTVPAGSTETVLGVPKSNPPKGVAVGVACNISEAHICHRNSEFRSLPILEPPSPPIITHQQAIAATAAVVENEPKDDLPEIRRLFQESIENVEQFKRRELTKAKSVQERKAMADAIDVVKDNINYQLQLYEEVRRGFDIIHQLRVEQTAFHKKFLNFRAKFYFSWNSMGRVGLGYNQDELMNLKRLSDEMKVSSSDLENFSRKLDDIHLKNKRQDHVLTTFCKKMDKCLMECNKLGKSLSFEQFQTIGLPDLNWQQLHIYRNAIDTVKTDWDEFEERETIKIADWLLDLAEICLIFGIHLQNDF